jgi:hypothetical protein
LKKEWLEFVDEFNSRNYPYVILILTSHEKLKDDISQRNMSMEK